MRVELHGGVAVLLVESDLDIGTADVLAEQLRAALALASDVLVVDLGACGFVGVQQFEQIERAARALQARSGQLTVQTPPASFLLIRDHSPRCCSLVVTDPPQP